MLIHSSIENDRSRLYVRLLSGGHGDCVHNFSSPFAPYVCIVSYKRVVLLLYCFHTHFSPPFSSTHHVSLLPMSMASL